MLVIEVRRPVCLWRVVESRSAKVRPARSASSGGGPPALQLRRGRALDRTRSIATHARGSAAMSAAPPRFGRVARSATRGLWPARGALAMAARIATGPWQSWHDCATDDCFDPERRSKLGSRTRPPCTGRFLGSLPTPPTVNYCTVNSWSPLRRWSERE